MWEIVARAFTSMHNLLDEVFKGWSGVRYRLCQCL